MLTNNKKRNLPPIAYWRLWLFDSALVCAGMLFCLAVQYGTYEFFGKACAMALLPLIPLVVLVGGASSTVFALTKVWIEKRAISRPVAVLLLVGPALILTLLLGFWGAGKAPSQRLAYLCLGNAPASVSHVQVAGYSTFLRSEWLAVFNVDQNHFQSFVAGAKLEPGLAFAFNRVLACSTHQGTRLLQSLPPMNNCICFQRVFREAEEHLRGGVYAAFDPATSTAVVFREYHD